MMVCWFDKKKVEGKNCPDSTAATLHWTCCHSGRSVLDGGVVAQLSLHAVGLTEARLWCEEGGRRLAEGGLLLGCGGRGLAFALVRLPITRARLLGDAAGNCGGNRRENQGQHLPRVACLCSLIGRQVLLLDGRGLEDRQRAEAAACRSPQRGSQRRLPLGTGTGVTIWKRDHLNELIDWLIVKAASMKSRQRGSLTFSDR